MLYDFIERVVMWFYALPPFPVLMVLGILLGLPTTLIHELGHGIAANVVAKVRVKIEISLSGLDWAGACKLEPGSQASLGAYMVVVGAGPLASFAQGIMGVWLTTMLAPGTAVYAVAGVFGLWGMLAGAINLVPITQPGMHSDGQKLLDLSRLAVTGRVPNWIELSPTREDPHAATSVPPPG